MTEQTAQIVIAGGGLAASLAALRLAPAARVLLIDQRADPLVGHTWSFHSGDIDAAQRAWLANLVIDRRHGLCEYLPVDVANAHSTWGG